jgi:GNAT superfamily N-acetyltransferase
MSQRKAFHEGIDSHTAYQYKFTKGKSIGTINAFHKGNMVGSLFWDKDSGEVGHIEVEPEHRGLGVSDGLWNEAKAKVKELGWSNLVHNTIRTKAGDKFAKRVSKDNPEEIPSLWIKAEDM